MRDYDRPNLAQYLNRGIKGAEKSRPLDFKEKYRSRPPGAPFKNDRFTATDLIARIQSRKLSFNKRLGFYPEQVFPELGRFDRSKYDFKTGSISTVENPSDQPGFDPEFLELYNYSPVVPPGKKVNNPMPTAENPDPKGFLAAMGESKLNALLNKPPSTEKELKFEEKDKIVEQSNNARSSSEQQEKKLGRSK